MSLIHKDVDTIVGYLFGQVYPYDKISHTKFYNDLYIVFKNYPYICQGIHRSRLKINLRPEINNLRMRYTSFWISLLQDLSQGKETITFLDDQKGYLRYSLFKLAEIFGYYCVQTNQRQKECFNRTSITISSNYELDDIIYYSYNSFGGKIIRCNPNFIWSDDSRNITEEEKKFFLTERKKRIQNYLDSYLDRLYKTQKVCCFYPSDLIDLQKLYTLEYLKKRHINWGKMEDEDSWLSTGEFNDRDEELFKFNYNFHRHRRCFLKNFGGRLKLVKMDVTTEKFRNDLATDYEDQLQLFDKRKRERKYRT